MTKNAVLPVIVKLANTGTVDGDETVMVFVSYPSTTARRPAKELKAFQRVTLKAVEEKTVTIPVRVADLKYWQGTATGAWTVESGPVKVMAGPNWSTLPLTAMVSVK
jgi:beta-glucosidase